MAETPEAHTEGRRAADNAAGYSIYVMLLTV